MIHQCLVRTFLTIYFKNVAGFLNSGQINAAGQINLVIACI